MEASKIIVVGPFRSGTNIMNDSLQKNYLCNVEFSPFFWKHCVPPHRAEGIIPEDYKIIVMVRNPIAWNLSLFRFWHSRRRELMPDRKLSNFIKSPLVVYDNTNGFEDIRYHFSTPTDYWNKFYYAWAFWKTIQPRVSFVRLEKFIENPRQTFELIEGRFKLTRRRADLINPTDEYVGPLVPRTWDGLDKTLSREDESFIKSSALKELGFY